MPLFRNETHAAIWLEHHCARCYREPKTCPILLRAKRTGRKPPEWVRNPRKGVLMQDTIKCTEESRTPPILKHDKMFDDVPMFDVDTPADMDSEHQ